MNRADVPGGIQEQSFRRAIERGNLLVAEMTAREIGWLSLEDALELTALFVEKDPRRLQRAACRWLQRYLAAAHLGRLGDPDHAEALASLGGMARKAAVPAARPRVA